MGPLALPAEAVTGIRAEATPAAVFAGTEGVGKHGTVREPDSRDTEGQGGVSEGRRLLGPDHGDRRVLRRQEGARLLRRGTVRLPDGDDVPRQAGRPEGSAADRGTGDHHLRAVPGPRVDRVPRGGRRLITVDNPHPRRREPRVRRHPGLYVSMAVLPAPCTRDAMSSGGRLPGSGALFDAPTTHTNLRSPDFALP